MDIFRRVRLRQKRSSLNLIASISSIFMVLLIVIYQEEIQLFVRYNHSPFRAIWTPHNLSDYEIVDYQETLESGKYQHGCHAFIYAVDGSVIFNNFPIRAKIMMHMRIDGYIGFPGGLIGSDEPLAAGLNREMKEELDVDTDLVAFTTNDLVVSYANKRKGFVDHVFIKRVSNEEFLQIEGNMKNSRDYGVEIFGPLRVPLFTLEDGFRGFPNFMTNKFVGNSLQELIYCIIKTGIMTEYEVQTAVQAVSKFNSSINLQLQTPSF